MYDAIVLAGGASRRLGRTDKTVLELDGVSLLERVLAAVAGAARVVVVGDARPLPSIGRAVQWRRESPPGSGPVAALAAGLPATDADMIVVLAADLPFIAAAVPVLVAAVPIDGSAALVDSAGRVNHLAAAWRRAALAAALEQVGEPGGAPMHALLRGIAPVPVPDIEGWGEDCDTWDDVTSARARLRR